MATGENAEWHGLMVGYGIFFWALPVNCSWGVHVIVLVSEVVRLFLAHRPISRPRSCHKRHHGRQVQSLTRGLSWRSFRPFILFIHLFMALLDLIVDISRWRHWLIKLYLTLIDNLSKKLVWVIHLPISYL